MVSWVGSGVGVEFGCVKIAKYVEHNIGLLKDWGQGIIAELISQCCAVTTVCGSVESQVAAFEYLLKCFSAVLSTGRINGQQGGGGSYYYGQR